jgi:hypothetical protein
MGKVASFVSFVSNTRTDFIITEEMCSEALRKANMEYKVLRSGPIAFAPWASLSSSATAISLLSLVALSITMLKREIEFARISAFADLAQLRMGTNMRRKTPVPSG